MKKGTLITLLISIVLMLVGGCMAAVGYGMGGWAAALELAQKSPYLNLANGAISIEYDDFGTREIEGGHTYTYDCKKITKLYLDIGSVNAKIIDNTTDEDIKVTIKNCKYGVQEQNNSLSLKFVGLEGKQSEVLIEIPKGHEFAAATLNAGASNVQVDSMIVGYLNINVGAGDVKIGELIANENSELDLGAGNLEIGNCKMDNVGINCGAGNVDLSGIINGTLNVECGMGNVSMNLKDKSANHNLYLEAALGNVHLNGKKYSGIVDAEEESDDAYSDYNIECSMGNIDIIFTED